MTEAWKRPSEVFAARLRETRKARGLKQSDVAQRMTEHGRPMNKAAVLRIERGERGLGLDEAIALAATLSAVPAQLLTPREGERVGLTDKLGVDGLGMRGWLRFGDSAFATAGDLEPERVADLTMQAVFGHARALVDAHRAEDKAGIQEAFRALRDTFRNGGEEQ